MDKKEMEDILHDTIIEAPLQFEAGGRSFCIHPKSLGLIILLDRLKDRLEIDDENVKMNPMLEMLRVCEAKNDIVLRMLAYAVLKDKDKVYNPDEVKKTMDFFDKNLTNDDKATLLTHILRDEQDVAMIIRGHFKIDQEIEDKKKVTKDKASNTLTFGGEDNIRDVV